MNNPFEAPSTQTTSPQADYVPSTSSRFIYRSSVLALCFNALTLAMAVFLDPRWIHSSGASLGILVLVMTLFGLFLPFFAFVVSGYVLFRQWRLSRVVVTGVLLTVLNAAIWLLSANWHLNNAISLWP